MDAKHTPGPWKAEGFGIWSCVNGENRRVACTEYDKGEGAYKVRTEAEAVANARLIAAAPELVKALENLVEDCCKPQHLQEISVLEAARAALRKARGE